MDSADLKKAVKTLSWKSFRIALGMTDPSSRQQNLILVFFFWEGVDHHEVLSISVFYKLYI